MLFICASQFLSFIQLAFSTTDAPYCNSKESTLLPVVFLQALILLVPTAENGRRSLMDGRHMYFLSIAAYIISFRKGQGREGLPVPTFKIRYATWTALILAIIVTFFVIPSPTKLLSPQSH